MVELVGIADVHVRPLLRSDLRWSAATFAEEDIEKASILREQVTR